jgi:ankyrin repeat protein
LVLFSSGVALVACGPSAKERRLEAAARHEIELKRETPIGIAAAAGDLATVKALLDGGTSVDEQDGQGKTALYHAARNGKLDIVNLLLAHKANPNLSETVDGRSPLEAAAWNEHNDVMLALLAAGADVDSRDSSGETPLMKSGHGDDDIATARILVEHGADVNAEATRGTCVLSSMSSTQEKTQAYLESVGATRHNYVKEKFERCSGCAWRKGNRPAQSEPAPQQSPSAKPTQSRPPICDSYSADINAKKAAGCF